MPSITYNVKLKFQDSEDILRIIEMLEAERFTFNECSKIWFDYLKENPKIVKSIINLHDLFYSDFRKKNPEIPSQIVIKAEQEVLSKFKSIKSNGHEIEEAPEKINLSIQLDKRIYSIKGSGPNSIYSIISLGHRVKCSIESYKEVEELFKKYTLFDPSIFVKNNEIYLSLVFKIHEIPPANDKSLGIDLGMRVAAATSEGKLYMDKKFNKEIRALRKIKRELKKKRKNSSSARRHLKKLRRKERNKNKNQSHLLSKRILQDTDASYIILEDLTGLKSNKGKKKKSKSKNRRLMQVPFYQLKQFLSYKAPLYGKVVETVEPRFTSQIDHRTGKIDGKRLGRRYIGKDGIILDADINAAINIVVKSQHPASIGNYLDGQGIVNCPNKSLEKGKINAQKFVKSQDLQISDSEQAPDFSRG